MYVLLLGEPVISVYVFIVCHEGFAPLSLFGIYVAILVFDCYRSLTLVFDCYRSLKFELKCSTLPF